MRLVGVAAVYGERRQCHSWPQGPELQRALHACDTGEMLGREAHVASEHALEPLVAHAMARGEPLD